MTHQIGNNQQQQNMRKPKRQLTFLDTHNKCIPLQICIQLINKPCSLVFIDYQYTSKGLSL